MRTTLKYILAFSLIAVLIASFSVSAKVYSGQEESFSWQIDLNSGHMEISGSGKLYDYANHLASPYSKFLPLIKTLEIGNGITAIGSFNFTNAYNLEKVALPDTLMHIGDSAFEACTKLSQINLPSGLSSIGKSAFSDCRSLDGVILPSSLSNLGNYAFCGCTSLTSINIPSEIYEIPIGAFSGCTELRTVSGLENVSVISEAAFYCCAALNIEKFPESITSISSRAFFGCTSLTSSIPTSVINKEGAFFNSNVLFDVIFNIDGKTEKNSVKVGELPSYDGTPKKNSVIDGIYLFDGWNSQFSPAVTSQNSYSALFRLSRPVLSSSYTVKDGYADVTAELDLSHLSCDGAYILFACYGEDKSLICSKRVAVTKSDKSAQASLFLRRRDVAEVKTYIYTDKNFITPLGESVAAVKE